MKKHADDVDFFVLNRELQTFENKIDEKFFDYNIDAELDEKFKEVFGESQEKK